MRLQHTANIRRANIQLDKNMRLRIILEAGYGRTYSFDYQKAQTDKRPRLLLLGKWRHPTTRNILLAGINLNYLTDEQLANVRKNLKAIIQPRNLKSRYWKGKQLLPDVFDNAYRTYDKDYVGSITKDTLKYWPTDEALEKAEKEAQDAEAKKKEAELKKAAAPGVAAPPAPAAPAAPGVEPVKAPEVAAPAAPAVPAAPTEPAAPAAPAEPAAPAPTEPAPAPTSKQRRAKPAPAPAEPAAPAPAAAEPAAAPTPAEPAPPVEPPAEPPKPEPLTPAQKRKKQAQQIEKAIQRTKPQPKPEPPPEIGGAVSMFKPKSSQR